MKKTIKLAILFFHGQLAFAQAPWNVKVMLHNPIYGFVDTVWVGCDSAGAWGFQDGLDIIDTTIETPFGLWSDDSLITDGCFNLRKDVKNFLTGIQYYDLQMLDSGSFNPPDYIKIDTNEFKFDNGSYKITGAGIEVIECGYVMAFDNTDWPFYNGGDTINLPDNPFYTDSISLIPEGGYFCCVSLAYSQMRTRMWVAFNAYVPTGFEAIEHVSYRIFPNPSNGLIKVSGLSGFSKFNLLNAIGGSQFRGSIVNSGNYGIINVNSVPSGIYLLSIIDESHRKQVNKKVVIE
ncbi:MAG: T9SS type A sorting domain-containing protein [Chitinophagales bacterium]|nr:T9SS type A sorting domain-containing protein [Chitinophagales bacterium]